MTMGAPRLQGPSLARKLLPCLYLSSRLRDPVYVTRSLRRIRGRKSLRPSFRRLLSELPHTSDHLKMAITVCFFRPSKHLSFKRNGSNWNIKSFLLNRFPNGFDTPPAPLKREINDFVTLRIRLSGWTRRAPLSSPEVHSVPIPRTASLAKLPSLARKLLPCLYPKDCLAGR